jgi:hypothetical protein
MAFEEEGNIEMDEAERGLRRWWDAVESAY